MKPNETVLSATSYITKNTRDPYPCIFISSGEAAINPFNIKNILEYKSHSTMMSNQFLYLWQGNVHYTVTKMKDIGYTVKLKDAFSLKFKIE